MRLKVAMFGALRERLGVNVPADMEMDTGTTLQEALRKLEREIGPLGAGVAVAVNGSLTRGNPALSEGDEIFLLPPVSGG